LPPFAELHKVRAGNYKTFATIPVREEDVKVVKILDAHVNERIKVQFGKEVDQTKSFAEKPDDLSDYRI
jgi:hypothetical protein